MAEHISAEKLFELRMLRMLGDAVEIANIMDNVSERERNAWNEAEGKMGHVVMHVPHNTMQNIVRQWRALSPEEQENWNQ